MTKPQTYKELQERYTKEGDPAKKNELLAQINRVNATILNAFQQGIPGGMEALRASIDEFVKANNPYPTKQDYDRAFQAHLDTMRDALVKAGIDRLPPIRDDGRAPYAIFTAQLNALRGLKDTIATEMNAGAGLYTAAQIKRITESYSIPGVVPTPTHILPSMEQLLQNMDPINLKMRQFGNINTSSEIRFAGGTVITTPLANLARPTEAGGRGDVS